MKKFAIYAIILVLVTLMCPVVINYIGDKINHHEKETKLRNDRLQEDIITFICNTPAIHDKMKHLPEYDCLGLKD